MATIARSQAAGFTDYGAEAEDIARRRKMAEMMQMQALEPIKQETAGGYVVPISWTQGLAKALQAGVGGYQQGQLRGEARDLAARRAEAITGAVRDMPQDRVETAPGPDDGSGIPSPNVTTRTPVTWQEQAGWLGKLAQVDPMALQLGQSVLGMRQKEQENAATRDARTMDRIMQLDAAAQNAALSREERAARAAEAAALRRDLANQQEQTRRDIAEANRQGRIELAQTVAGLRQPPQPQAPVVIIGPDGKPVYADPRSAIGQTPYAGSPQAQASKPMSATAQRELIQTDEEIASGMQTLDFLGQAKKVNNEAMGFPGAGAVASVGGFLPESMRPKTVDATQNLTNIITNSALPQLKAIFGGNPTEGERKVLLDVQGSAGQPPAVRKEIFDRAEQAVNARLRFARQKAQALRNGSYFAGDGGGGAPPAPRGASAGATGNFGSAAGGVIRFDAQGNQIP